MATMDTTTTSRPDEVNQEVLGQQALMRLLPELKALPEKELVQVQLDIPDTVATVLGSLPDIRALRPEIEATMKGFDLVAFDKLEDYALALADAHTEYQIATKPMDDLDQMVEEGTKLRAKLDADSKALATHGLIDREKLAELQGGTAYKSLATDLSIYAKVFSKSWSDIQNRVASNMADVERAAKIGQRLIRVIGLREQATQTVEEATDVRLRAYTMLLRVYDEVRRAVTFLRWQHRDADSIAPSLFAGRTRRKPAAAPPPAADNPTVPPAGTVSLPKQPSGAKPTNPGDTAPAQSLSGASPGSLPGREPFIS